MHTVLCVASLRDFKGGIYLTEWFFGISFKEYIDRVIVFYRPPLISLYRGRTFPL